MLYAVLLIILGLLAIPSLIISKKPEAKQLFDKVAPYQGWFGVIFCIWGIWGIISSILNISWLSVIPIWWVTFLLIAIVEAVLGFILGYGLIQKYALSKSPEAAKKGEEVLAKLLPLQGKFGIAAIIIGLWAIVANIMWHL
ncbi:MAG: hypothetical protein LBE82_07825 [Chitinophagaceae bacterium]|jgi:hypothetical protein|nr:hypothetical protein [Chitinophagaceae bacterium]